MSVVIPAKNEARNIGWVLERIPPGVDEVIIVDGLSHDGTLEIAKMIDPDVIVVSEKRPGKGAAVRAGFATATGKYVVMLDADGSMDPAEISRYVAALEAGHDLVKGSRFMAGGSSTDITLARDLGNKFLLHLFNMMYGARCTELCYGYMGLRRSVIDQLDLTADGFEIETEIVVRSVRNGLRICEVPSTESPRRHGSSNLNAVRDGLRILRTLLDLRVRPRVATGELVAIPIEERSTSAGRGANSADRPGIDTSV